MLEAGALCGRVADDFAQLTDALLQAGVGRRLHLVAEVLADQLSRLPSEIKALSGRTGGYLSFLLADIPHCSLQAVD